MKGRVRYFLGGTELGPPPDDVDGGIGYGPARVPTEDELREALGWQSVDQENLAVLLEAIAHSHLGTLTITNNGRVTWVYEPAASSDPQALG